MKSSVVDSSTGLSKDSEVRTSTGTFFAKGQTDVITRIEKRVAQVGCKHREAQRGRVSRAAAMPGCGGAVYHAACG